MRLTVLTVGRTRRGPLADLERDYLQRIERFAPIARADVPASRAGTRDGRRRAEAFALAAKLSGTTVALDAGGRALSSDAFRAALESWRARGEVVFVLGGPDGLDDALLGTARERLSLGPMTLPHELALVVLLEQIYRALAAGANHPYARH